MTGSGTLLDPFVIYNVTDLQAMEDDLTAYYELANDIDASATVGWNGGLGFDPVGDTVNRFSGSFDGKGYAISDLTIDRPATNYIGLFGRSEGTISNVDLVDVYIVGHRQVGALVGGQGFIGSITSCSSSGEVRAVDPTNIGYQVGGLIGGVTVDPVTKCHSSCTVYTEGGAPDYVNRVGGLIGSAGFGSIISKCFATGTVTGRKSVGGLIGSITGDDTQVVDCYARGAVIGEWRVGGLIGQLAWNAVSVDNCYSTGAVSGTIDVGGLIGENGAGAPVTDSFWDIETSGQAASDGGTGKTTAQMKTESTFTDAGWDFATIWTICGGVNNDYPCLLGVTPSCVLGPVVVIPTVTTNPATAISHLSAVPNGFLDAGSGEACACGFEWGLTPAYGHTTLTESKVTGESFSRAIHGLFPGFTYHFRAFATNSAGIGYGDDRSFITTPSFNRAHALSREEL